jgi:hypothetical protein
MIGAFPEKSKITVSSSSRKEEELVYVEQEVLGDGYYVCIGYAGVCLLRVGAG